MTWGHGGSCGFYHYGMGNLLFNARVAFMNWRLRQRKCRVCRSIIPAGGGTARYESKGQPIFCGTDCRDDWQHTVSTP